MKISIKIASLLLPAGIVFSTHTTSASAVTPAFTEVSATVGISFQSESNVMSAGIAWIDYDNDGHQDLFIPNETGANRLYRNLGDPEGDGAHNGFSLVTGANIELNSEPNQGVAIGDYDADGFDDIFLANGNKGANDPINKNTLLRNKGDIDNDGNHDGFEVVTTAAGLDNELNSSMGASFGDLNADSYLELYVGHWDGLANGGVCYGNDLYLNDGSGGFSHISVEAMAGHAGCAFAVPMTDFDEDGDLDLFTINDNILWAAGNPGLDNEMLRNDGVNGMGIPVFSEVGDIVGLGEGMTAMGVAIGDYNSDGHIDYYRSQIDAGILSTNDGTGNFSASTLPDDVGTGWGTVFLDANNDGFLDLYRGNSRSGFSDPTDPVTAYQANTFFLNSGDGTFSSDIAGSVGLTSMNAGLGMATADYDNDGDVDVVVHGQNGSVNLFRNDTSSNNDWLKINLIGTSSNNRGIGAKARVTSTSAAGTLNQMREVVAGSSHGSTNAFPVHFGFPADSTIDQINIEWPSGQEQTLSNLTLTNISLNVEEGVPEPTITEFAPPAGAVGVGGSVIGTNLCVNECYTGFGSGTITETRVVINGVDQDMVYLTPDFVLFHVAAGTPSGSGPVTVITPGGQATSTQEFTVLPPPPTITEFAPPAGAVGIGGSVIGTNLCVNECYTGFGSGTITETRVVINGVDQDMVYLTPDFVLFYVAAGTPLGSGPVTVITPGGQATSTQEFTVLPLPPTITEFAPPAGAVGIGGSVIGTNLCVNECYTGFGSGTITETRVVINGVDQDMVYLTPDFVLFYVAAGTPLGSGPVTVITPGGQATSTQEFTILPSN